eukprot:CAMPEP_0195519430 /NCGR_PEP_ID=MMETSP0794_2-20130614/14741_1 /TAXON_ID=515487 /ORGANISM="Stephanopyxis turris, Strain CCMP 815" /LENGTH=71 /DNA_ID=CAMNT_0040648581 /DNA_START=55 /DNA_END=270 /DNA_ORIENTATION=+
MNSAVLMAAKRVVRTAQRRTFSTIGDASFAESVTGNSLIGGGLGLIGGLMWKSFATNSNQTIKKYYAENKQ